jgi:hypothetical protein
MIDSFETLSQAITALHVLANSDCDQMPVVGNDSNFKSTLP